jgi:hypothetical protein
MTKTFLSGMQHAANRGGRFGTGVRAVLIATFVVACALLIINGPRIRAALEAERASFIEAEDRAFCSKFGLRPETSRFAKCAAGLNEIRTRHLQRSTDLFF